MSRRYTTKAEHNAILAGLRLLQIHIQHHGDAMPDGIDGIMSDLDVHPIAVHEIDELCEAIVFDEVQLRVVEDDDNEET